MCDDAAAPIVLYDTVTALPPLNVVPDAAPAPPLLKVTLLGVFDVMVILADPLNDVPFIVLGYAKTEADVANDALVALVAVVAYDELPVMLIFQVPLALPPVSVGVYPL